MLQPKRTKYRKYQKGCSSGQGRVDSITIKKFSGKNNKNISIGRISSNRLSLSFGQFGIKSLEHRLVTANQVIAKFENELEQAIEVWGYPEESEEPNEGAQDVQAQ